MASGGRRGGSAPAAFTIFIPTIFLSAFLIFQVQPMVSKHILPWFGGSPAVWTTCLVFFQALLFAGYAYAHLSASRVPPRWQAPLHVVLLIAAVFVSVLPANAWKPLGDEYPIARIVQMLFVSVGLPFFVLCASGPLLQAWFARLHPGRSPYRLFAVSNAGSLLALLSYPFLFEPRLSVTRQAGVWSWLFYVLIVLSGVVAWSIWRKATGEGVQTGNGAKASGAAKEGERSRAGKGAKAKKGAAPGGARKAVAPEPPTPLKQTFWILWSACGVILFMAVTNQLTLNVASVPFLWIVPLSIYLLSFVLAFGDARWYPRRLFSVLLVGAFLVFFLLLPGEILTENTVLEMGTVQKIAITAIALFVCCLVCHGELHRLRPPSAYLTRFYLSVSFGGLLGGIIVGVVAPSAFLILQELQIGLVLCCVLYLATFFRDPASVLRGGRPRWAWAAMIAGLSAMVVVSFQLSVGQLRGTVRTERNFFGLLRVMKETGEGTGETPHVTLHHGSTLHGMQFTGAEHRRLPTLYYGPITGAGVVLTAYTPPRGRRIGVVGMGVATLAAYGRPEDSFWFYELDPDVIEIARENFTFLADSEAESHVQVGDARLSLEREPDHEFDILVLDAFNSDAIPVHLLTVEAMETYARHLHEDGIIAAHITNAHLDLSPVVQNMAATKGLVTFEFANVQRQGGTSARSRWVLASRNAALLEGLVEAASALSDAGLVRVSTGDAAAYASVRTWTDDFSNLFDIMK